MILFPKMHFKSSERVQIKSIKLTLPEAYSNQQKLMVSTNPIKALLCYLQIYS